MENNIGGCTVKGYKVFESDWTCRGKQYSCPGSFEEDVSLVVCKRGIHFCKSAIDCFNYYDFDPDNHVAEVVAYGKVAENGDKCCTNKLEIVREIPWDELLKIVNTGKNCTGFGNSGNYNSGNRNSGNYNSGHYNSGDWNSGNANSGVWNGGDYNSGRYNSGDYNSGNCNSGNHNSGNFNSGNHNRYDGNSGDWNKCNFSNGCFNTVTPKVYFFNKPSNWTYKDWRESFACGILSTMPEDTLRVVHFEKMTDEEKLIHPEAKTTGYYLRCNYGSDRNRRAEWWRGLREKERKAVMAIPNFDKEIFKQITGIDVEE